MGPERALGLKLGPMKKSLRAKFGIWNLEGVVVTHVKKGSPAAKKGFRTNMLILRVNNWSTPTVQKFRTELAKVKKGRMIIILVQLQKGRGITQIPRLFSTHRFAR